MKSKRVLWILLGLLALVTAFSCKSAPPVEEETPPPEVTEPEVVEPEVTEEVVEEPLPDQAALDALESAAARARDAKKLVGDFEGQTVFPADWNAADALFTQAEEQKNVTTLKQTQESTARYNAAADAFEAMSAKTLAAYHEKREKELTAARNSAVNARAAELIPDFLLDADNTVLDAETKYAAKDYYASRDAADKSLHMYTALNAGLAAYKVREEIADRDFVVYDPINTELADNTLRSAANDYTGQNFASAKTKSDDALARYNQSLKTGWESFSAEKGADASTERQKALSQKANVAVRQDYNSAQAVYVRANSAFQAQRYDEAARLYDECASSFEVIAQVALEKRLAAEEALKKANEKMTQSDEAARNAEIVLEGGVE